MLFDYIITFAELLDLESLIQFQSLNTIDTMKQLEAADERC